MAELSTWRKAHMKSPADPTLRRAHAREWREMRRHNPTRAREAWREDREFLRMIRRLCDSPMRSAQ